MKVIKYIIFSFLFFIPVMAHADLSNLKIYDEAKEAYFNKKYNVAEKKFSALLKYEPQNGYLHYNLGNVYFKMGKLGKAIQQYEKAKLTIPRDMDLKLNLVYARTKLVDEVTVSFSDYLNQTFYFWSSSLDLSDFRLLLVIYSFTFWGFCLFLFLRKKRLITTKMVIAFLLLAYVSCGYWIKSDLEAPGIYGVVIKPEVDVKASYLDQDKPLFLLHEGSKVRIIDKQNFGEDQKWYRIALPEGQKGWVPASEIGVI